MFYRAKKFICIAALAFLWVGHSSWAGIGGAEIWPQLRDDYEGVDNITDAVNFPVPGQRAIMLQFPQFGDGPNKWSKEELAPYDFVGILGHWQGDADTWDEFRDNMLATVAGGADLLVVDEPHFGGVQGTEDILPGDWFNEFADDCRALNPNVVVGVNFVTLEEHKIFWSDGARPDFVTQMWYLCFESPCDESFMGRLNFWAKLRGMKTGMWVSNWNDDHSGVVWPGWFRPSIYQTDAVFILDSESGAPDHGESTGNTVGWLEWTFPATEPSIREAIVDLNRLMVKDKNWQRLALFDNEGTVALRGSMYTNFLFWGTLTPPVFRIHDGDENIIAAVDSDGDLYLRGSATENATIGTYSTPAFPIQNKDGDTVAVITNDGDLLCLKEIWENLTP